MGYQIKNYEVFFNAFMKKLSTFSYNLTCGIFYPKKCE
ncbi:hypothetical protein M23134_00176 [Microscilla marina ATCC 23134]|uniref:Uncharacterized protein n=1 Tax=Microscilla marina ATCC 23134 TaxID=313606 RepID=A1ZL55_MICM2|nr:hypothetical protein M23134_00176 [Microscilla marina ATCC 23134]